MKPNDPRLPLIASMAKVRPPHVFHCWHSMAELGRGFDAEAFGIFAQLELRHVTAIVEALTAKGWAPAARAPRAASTKSHASRLPADFQVPADWIMAAREKRLWSDAETRDEAESFVDHFHKTGQAYVDWQAAWRGWFKRSRRPDGTSSPAAEARKPEDRAVYLRGVIGLYESQGRGDEAQHWRDELARIDSNVIQLRPVAHG